MDEPFVIGIARCVACARPFAFDPETVPVALYQGERQPVCRDCLEIVNVMRQAKGLEPLKPEPGAYGPGAL